MSRLAEGNRSWLILPNLSICTTAISSADVYIIQKFVFVLCRNKSIFTKRQPALTRSKNQNRPLPRPGLQYAHIVRDIHV